MTADNVKSSIEQIDEPWVSAHLVMQSIRHMLTYLFMRLACCIHMYDIVHSCVQDKRNGWSESAQFEVTSLSSEHMDVKVTDPERSQLSSSSSVSTTSKHTEETKDRGEEVEDNSRTPSSDTQRKAQSPLAETQVHNKSMHDTKLGSESKKTKAVHSFASSTAEYVTLTGVETTEAHGRDSNSKDKDIEGQSDPVSETEKERNKSTISGSKEAGQCELVEPSKSSLSVENDGSVFVRADKDYTQTKPLEQIAKAQEKGTKIQFSNQLAFSLD